MLQHPVYATWAPVWKQLIQVYDGSGGFLDGTFLVAHPREWKDWTSDAPRVPTKKLKARRALARYENVGATILDQKRSALFRDAVNRSVGDGSSEQAHPLEDWWKNVDGEGCSISDWMSDAFVWAGLFGHVFHYMDRESTPEGAMTAAEGGSLILRLYNPLDVPDWVQSDRGALKVVKLLEPTERTDINTAATMTDGVYYERIVDDTNWTLQKVEAKGKSGRVTVTPEDGPHPHQFGVLPVVVQYGKRKAFAPLIGQPILGDPKLYIDLYNLTSEIREILRAQTFGMLNVPLGTTADKVGADEAKQMMGDETGVENVLFTPGPAQYVQPDTDNITVYQAEHERLLRIIYRMVGLPWESDSKDAEAEGSLQKKREDLNQLLSLYAANCEKAETEIAKLWFRGTHGDRWEQEWDKAQVVIRYPKTFDTTPFEEMLEQAQAAETIGFGPQVKGEIKKRLLPQFLPDATPQQMTEFEAECEEAATQQAEMDAKQKDAEVKATEAKASGGFGA